MAERLVGVVLVVRRPGGETGLEGEVAVCIGVALWSLEYPSNTTGSSRANVPSIWW